MADLPPGACLRVDADPPIAVFNVDGELFATADTCTHMSFSLCDGALRGDQIECPVHRARFSVRTGEALTLPAKKPLCTVAVRVVDDHIYVDPMEEPS